MIGTRVTRTADKATFTITAQTDDGSWVLTPDEFGTLIKVDPDELHTKYGVKNPVSPKRTDEQQGWNRLGAAFRETFQRAQRGVMGGRSPEQTFAILSGADAAAARIAADEDRLAEFEAGLLDVPPDVAKQLDAIVARRNAADADA